MNPVDRLLWGEMDRLLDRIAATVPEGSLAAATAGPASLRSRLDETEARLAALRATLLETYGAWGKALADLENLWALATWRHEEASLAA
jgi:O-methyltransferase involved in polyketide biosynthesis